MLLGYVCCLGYEGVNKESSESDSEDKSDSISEEDSAEEFANLKCQIELENGKEPIVELAEDSIEVAWWDVSGMALAGCPSAKDVVRIATQKSMEKPEPEESEEEEEETSEEESEEDEDPTVTEEKRQQRELKLMKTKIRNFK